MLVSYNAVGWLDFANLHQFDLFADSLDSNERFKVRHAFIDACKFCRIIHCFNFEDKSIFTNHRLYLASAGERHQKKSFYTALHSYSKLHLLSTLYNQSVGEYFLSQFKTTTAVSCVASAFILVKLIGLGDFTITCLSIGCAFVFVGTFSVMTNFCSRVHEDSVQLRLFLLSRIAPGREPRRRMECYKVIGVKIGSFFLVRRVTPLTMLAMISNTTMTALISVNFSV